MTRHEVGIDLIDVDRIVAVLGRYPDRFRQRILTPSEDRYCRGKAEKDRGAVGGQGGSEQGAGPGRTGRWLARDRGASKPRRGSRRSTFTDGLRRGPRPWVLGEVTVSISHERRMAVAVAMADRPEGAPRAGETPWR